MLYCWSLNGFEDFEEGGAAGPCPFLDMFVSSVSRMERREYLAMKQLQTKDYYSTLGVKKTATSDDIRKAFRKLARKYHPDVNPNDKKAEEKFKEISGSERCLLSDEKREVYDQFGFYSDNIDPAAAEAARAAVTALPVAGRPPRAARGGGAQRFPFDFWRLRFFGFRGRAARTEWQAGVQRRWVWREFPRHLRRDVFQVEQGWCVTRGRSPGRILSTR